MTRSAWDRFWANERAGRSGGCLAEGPPALKAAQRQFWQGIARSLPRAGRVLDLATGDGVVMSWLIAARPDLKPFGIDLSPHIPKPPKGCRVRGGISMEALPVEAESQDAVVSQFGVEYGDLPRVVAEIDRVLKKGGRVGLMTHRADGPIVEFNRHRRAGLAWALDDAKLIEKARAGLSVRHMGFGLPPAIASGPNEGAARFGTGSAAWEFAETVRQTLTRTEGKTDEAVLSMLALLERKARDEIERIDELEAASAVASDGVTIETLFAERGLELQSSGPLREAGGARPAADIWMLRKPIGPTGSLRA